MDAMIDVIKVVYLGFVTVLDYIASITYFGPIILSMLGLMGVITVLRGMLGGK